MPRSPLLKSHTSDALQVSVAFPFAMSFRQML